MAELLNLNQNKMEQTAVEWLYNKMLYIDNEYDMKLITKSEYQFKRRDIIEQALEMEIKQSHEYAEFAIKCDRLDMKILNFDGYMNLENTKDANR